MDSVSIGFLGVMGSLGLRLIFCISASLVEELLGLREPHLEGEDPGDWPGETLGLDLSKLDCTGIGWL